jgi:hypothetical protein
MPCARSNATNWFKDRVECPIVKICAAILRGGMTQSVGSLFVSTFANEVTQADDPHQATLGNDEEYPPHNVGGRALLALS